MMDNIDLMLEWLDKLEHTQHKGAQKPEAEDGGLALSGGVLLIKKPGRGGKWPTIVAGAGEPVQILDRGERVDKPRVVQNTEYIDLCLSHKAPKSSFNVDVSRDGMEVWLETEFAEGVEYGLVDSDYVSDLVVTTRELRRQPPPPLNSATVLQELERIGVKVEVDVHKLHSACEGGLGQRVLIAKGIPAKQPIDGWIEPVYDLSGRKIKRQKGDRVDWFDQGQIESVKPGEVVAYWHPPTEGKPGINVFGEKVEPRHPKWSAFSAGPGVELLENGTIAVAKIAGRPTMELGRLCVKPQLVITSDVDITTGNVDFTGDVLVAGDVREALIIKAGGIVQIGRSVYHASILAGGSVNIGRNLIGGRVAAGGDVAAGMKLVALIKQLIPLLEKLHKISRQLKSHPRFSRQDLKLRGDGYLIKLVIEKRLAAIPRLCGELISLLPDIKELGEEDETAPLCAILHYVGHRFQGPNPLDIGSISELQKCITALKKVLAFLQDALSTPADVTVKYCQNSHIEATGDITATGPLVYACSMSAGRNIRLAGSCRGGHYSARSSIAIKSAGLNEMVRTYFSVEEGGFVAAEKFFPGVTIKIGSNIRTIREPRRNTLLRFTDGQWLEQDWRWGQ